MNALLKKPPVPRKRRVRQVPAEIYKTGDKIFNVKGIPTDQQRLTFDKKQLENNRKLSFYKIRNSFCIHLSQIPDYNIQNESTIHLFTLPRSVQIIVINGNNEKLILDVLDNDIILTVKQKIQGKNGILTNIQSLFLFVNKLIGVDELEDLKHISEYNIQNGSTLFLSGQLTSTMEVNPSYNNNDLNLKIQHDEGTAFHEQRLIFAGNQLEDSQIITDCDIIDGSNLEMFKPFTPMVIVVEDDDNDEVNVNVEATSSILNENPYMSGQMRSNNPSTEDDEKTDDVNIPDFNYTFYFSSNDSFRFKDGVYYNDSIINIYLATLVQPNPSIEAVPSFLYTALVNETRFRQPDKNKLLLIPICIWYHWSLVVMNRQFDLLLHCDSVIGSAMTPIRLLQKF